MFGWGYKSGRRDGNDEQFCCLICSQSLFYLNQEEDKDIKKRRIRKRASPSTFFPFAYSFLFLVRSFLHRQKIKTKRQHVSPCRIFNVSLSKARKETKKRLSRGTKTRTVKKGGAQNEEGVNKVSKKKEEKRKKEALFVGSPVGPVCFQGQLFSLSFLFLQLFLLLAISVAQLTMFSSSELFAL